MGAVCWAVYHPEHVMASLVRFLVAQAWAADVLAPYPFEKMAVRGTGSSKRPGCKKKGRREV